MAKLKTKFGEIDGKIKYSLKLNQKEFAYLHALLGNHVVGKGKYRDINYNIWNALDFYHEGVNKHDAYIEGMITLNYDLIKENETL